MSNTYPWIDPAVIPAIANGQRLILFGAGQGSVNLLAWFEEKKLRPLITAIADNDNTMQGKKLVGIPIIAPEAIQAISFSHILVTTISGKDAVAAQLSQMGYTQGIHFTCIGAYPSQFQNNLSLLFQLDRQTPFLCSGQRILHVGPGGFLGLECILYALGYKPLSMDAYTFGSNYPDVTDKMTEYRQARIHLQHILAATDRPTRNSVARYDELFVHRHNRIFLNQSRIRYEYPHRFSRIPLEDHAVDVILSFAVLEHVRSPKTVVNEIYRVLKPGGIAVQRIVTRDHRSFGQVSGYHPFSYLEHTATEWEQITACKFYQNRLLPSEWRNLFGRQGFDISYYQTQDEYALDRKTVHRMLAVNPHLNHLNPKQLTELNCVLIARKGR